MITEEELAQLLIRRFGPAPYEIDDENTGVRIKLSMFHVSATWEDVEHSLGIAADPAIELYPVFVDNTWYVAEHALREKIRYDVGVGKVVVAGSDLPHRDENITIEEHVKESS